MTGGFPEVKVISFGLHKHRHGRNVRVKKLYLYCISRRLRKHGDTMCWFLLKLFLFIAAIMINDNDYYLHYHYAYDGNDLYVFLEV